MGRGGRLPVFLGVLAFMVAGFSLAMQFEQPAVAATFASVNSITGAISLVNNDTNIVITNGVTHITVNLASSLTGLSVISFTNAIGQASCPANTVTFECYINAAGNVGINYNVPTATNGFDWMINGITQWTVQSSSDKAIGVPIIETEATPNTGIEILSSTPGGDSPLLGFQSSIGANHFCLGWQVSPDLGLIKVGSACGTVGIQIGSGGNVGLPNGIINNYNGISTQGNGVPAIYKATSQKSETGADANLLTYTPPAVAGSYWLCVAFDVKSVTTGTGFGWTATWTDAQGRAQAPTNLAMTITGTAAPVLTTTPVANTDYYSCAQIDINGAANIVIKTTQTGASVYTASAWVAQTQ